MKTIRIVIDVQVPDSCIGEPFLCASIDMHDVATEAVYRIEQGSGVDMKATFVSAVMA